MEPREHQWGDHQSASRRPNEALVGGDYRVRVTAPSIEGALKIVREGKLGRGVRLFFLINPKALFVPENSDQRGAV